MALDLPAQSGSGPKTQKRRDSAPVAENVLYYCGAGVVENTNQNCSRTALTQQPKLVKKRLPSGQHPSSEDHIGTKVQSKGYRCGQNRDGNTNGNGYLKIFKRTFSGASLAVYVVFSGFVTDNPSPLSIRIGFPKSRAHDVTSATKSATYKQIFSRRRGRR